MDRIIITIVLFILVSIPFIVFRQRISTWLSSVTEEADNKKEEKENSMSQNIFVVLTILLSPIFLGQVYSDSQFYFYIILYVAVAMGVLLVDPLSIITNSPLSDIVFYASTFLAYVVIYNRPFFPITLMCVMVLCISMTNIARSYMESMDKKPTKAKKEGFGEMNSLTMDDSEEGFEGKYSFYPIENYSNKSKKTKKKTDPPKEKKKDKMGLIYFLLYTIPFCIAFIFAVRPSLITYLLEVSKREATNFDIQMNPVLFTCVFFFVLFFYASTAFKHYYGGDQWISEPVSLLIPVEYKIEPSSDYMLSYWVYFDAIPPEYSTRASLFNNVVEMGTIQTRYQPSTTTLKVVVDDSDSSYEMMLLPQTWNNVVLVGSNGQLDMYVNGKLKHTAHSLATPNESLFIGEEGGNKGKICNVVYSPKSITPLMVQQLYTQLRLQSPPVL